MIPDLAVIVGAYVVFRAFESFLIAPSRYRAPIAQVFVFIAAGILILVTGFCVLDILTTGTPAVPALH